MKCWLHDLQKSDSCWNCGKGCWFSPLPRSCSGLLCLFRAQGCASHQHSQRVSIISCFPDSQLSSAGCCLLPRGLCRASMPIPPAVLWNSGFHIRGSALLWTHAPSKRKAATASKTWKETIHLPRMAEHSSTLFCPSAVPAPFQLKEHRKQNRNRGVSWKWDPSISQFPWIFQTADEICFPVSKGKRWTLGKQEAPIRKQSKSCEHVWNGLKEQKQFVVVQSVCLTSHSVGSASWKPSRRQLVTVTAIIIIISTDAKLLKTLLGALLRTSGADIVGLSQEHWILGIKTNTVLQSTW